MSDHCVVCGANVPEGRHICIVCEQEMLEKAETLRGLSFAKPKNPNVELSFGEDEEYSPNFSITYYRTKPLNKLQIWMYKVCFGIRAKNI